MTVHRQLSAEDWMEILRRRAGLLIVPAIACAIAGLIASFLVPRKYTSRTRVLVESPSVPDDYVKPVVSDDLNRRLASMQGEILSRTHLQSLIQQFHLYQNEWNRVPMDGLVDRLRKAISVELLSPTPGTQPSDGVGFNIDVTLGEPHLAQEVCSRVASMFINQDSEMRERQSEDTTQFLAQQLSDAKAKLDEQDAKLAEFQNQYLGAQPEDEQTNLTVLAGLTPQLEAATQSLNDVQENKAFTESMLSQQLAALKSSGGDDPQSLQQQLNDRQAQLVTLRARYTDKHPDVVKLKEEIADLQNRVKAAPVAGQAASQMRNAPIAEPAAIQQLRAQVHEADLAIAEKQTEQTQLQRQIRALQGRIQLTPMVQQQYKALTRDHQTALDFYNNLLKERDEAQMATDLQRRQEGENFTVLDPASFPEAPSFPDRRLFTFGGLVLGLALGAGLVRIAEMRDKSLRKVRDVETLLGVPTLAVIPERDSAQSALAGQMTPLIKLITPGSRSVSAR